MAEEFQERTEKATPRRRRESRKKGHVARSMEINTVLILLAGLISLWLFGPLVYRQLVDLVVGTFTGSHGIEVDESSIYPYMLSWLARFLRIIAPILLILAFTGLLSNFLQVGITLTGEPLIPKLSKISPISGFKRLFSKRSLEELFKGIVKLSIIGYISYVTIKGEIPAYLSLADRDIADMLSFTGRMTLRLGFRLALALLVLALFDYAFQKWEYEKAIRMTKQEVKEELKDIEGDPLIRSRVRSVQREMARKRMMQRVPEADVVITNPIRLAVALRYKVESMKAPVVIAKGQRLIAERIIAIARECGVPVVENVPLAQTLYRTVEIGMEIPEELYRVVAEILAYIFHLKKGAFDEREGED